MEGEGGVVRESLNEVTLGVRRDGEPGDGAWDARYRVGEGASLRDSKAGGAGLPPSKEEEQEVRSERWVSAGSRRAE